MHNRYTTMTRQMLEIDPQSLSKILRDVANAVKQHSLSPYYGDDAKDRLAYDIYLVATRLKIDEQQLIHLADKMTDCCQQELKAALATFRLLHVPGRYQGQPSELIKLAQIAGVGDILSDIISTFGETSNENTAPWRSHIYNRRSLTKRG